jgi:UTP:GlnB (protein PII) uridylyltransferase
MRIYETKHNDLNEGPLDLLTPSGRERRRAFKTGKQVSSTAIKQLGNEFARYLGTQGKRNFNQADTQEVIAFLKSKGVDTADIDTTQPMNQKRIENIFKQKVQQTTSLNRSAPTSPAAAQQGSSPAAAAPPASSAYTQTKTSAMKLSAKEKRRLIQQLQKTLPKANAAPAFRSRRGTP